MTPRLTVDLGLRVQHSGSDFETNNMNSGFFTDLWQRSNAARVYRLACTTGVPGNAACAGGTSARSIRPILASCSRRRSPATSCRARASNSTASSPAAWKAERTGLISRSRIRLRAARGYGVERHQQREGTRRLRSSWGIFYNFPRSTGDGGYPFSGGCPVSCSRQIRWSPLRRHHRRESVPEPDREPRQRHGRTATNSRWRNRTTSTWRSSATSASTPSRKSPGSATTPRTTGASSTTTGCAVPVWRPGQPGEQRYRSPPTRCAIIYGKYPGMGSANLYVPALYSKTLVYNAMQLRLARQADQRPADGLLAYTLAKGEGYDGLRSLTRTRSAAKRPSVHGSWGPTNDDRRHNISATWSYDVPTWTEDAGGSSDCSWTGRSPASSRLLSGQAVTPSCSVEQSAGINNTNPTPDRRAASAMPPPDAAS